MPTSAAYSVTCGHGVVQVQTAAEGHIWVYGSIAVKTCIDVHAPVTIKGNIDAQVWVLAQESWSRP